MSTFVNLVATRSLDGDHAALQRWYSDHVHLLMGFPGLQRATLFRRAGAAWDAEPDYLCLYEFASHDEFMAFEASAARQRAQQVVLHGWAKQGIEIVQRTQYLRLGRRSGPALASTQADLHLVQLLGLGAGAPDETARWLSDQVHALLEAQGAGHGTWHRTWGSDDAGGDALVLVQVPEPLQATSAPAWQTGSGDPDFGQAPATVDLHWQGLYRRQCTWER